MVVFLYLKVVNCYVWVVYVVVFGGIVIVFVLRFFVFYVIEFDIFDFLLWVVNYF